MAAEIPDRSPASVPSGLAALLELLHRADAPFNSVQATYRVWRHAERSRAAFLAEAEERKRQGAVVAAIQLIGTSTDPVEYEEVVRVWRTGDRVREERLDSRRKGAYGVRVGRLWWWWDEENGASTNEEDPSMGHGIGEQVAVMLNPTPLLGSLRFSVTGRSEAATRPAVSAEAVPRFAQRDGIPPLELHQIGTGADRYLLQIDAQRGVLLDCAAYKDGEVFHRITAQEISFDRPIPDERFAFEPPEGEPLRQAGSRGRPEHLSLVEAQQRAPFVVLMPSHVPADWRAHCVFVHRAERPPRPPQVLLSYRSDSGHEGVSLSQSSAGERPQAYEQFIHDESWGEVTVNGTVVHLNRAAGSGRVRTQAYVERYGSFVLITSETLTGEQVARIAASLIPVPGSSEV